MDRPQVHRFNPRPPRAGATKRLRSFRRGAEFQSAPPAWRGDLVAHRHNLLIGGFNPRPPRGGATSSYRIKPAVATVSIRAPRVEGRRGFYRDLRLLLMFQSAPPAWRGDLARKMP